MTQQITTYFAISLDKISLPKISSYNNEENKRQEFFIRQTEWLNCLAQNPNITFELRYICFPSQEHFKKGKIKIVLLGKTIESSPQEASSTATDVYNLCRTFFADIFEFSLIESNETIQELRKC